MIVCFLIVSTVFQGSNKGVSGKLQGYFKVVSRVFQSCFNADHYASLVVLGSFVLLSQVTWANPRFGKITLNRARLHLCQSTASQRKEVSSLTISCCMIVILALLTKGGFFYHKFILHLG